jgi:thioredoxin-related protein
LKLQKSKPKDLFITWHSRLNVGSLVMLYNAFEDSVVASYMNDHFYCVRLDAQTKDTLFWNKEYVNLNRDDRFHQLALEQLEENMKFPALIFYDINKNLIIRQHSYLGSVNFYMLASYVGSGAYRTQNFQEYRKSFKVEREHTR